MPNFLAYLMLTIWPLIGVVLFRRLPMAQALVWTILAGYLILPPAPAAFDFPILPPLSKETIPAITAFAIIMFMTGGKLGLMPKSPVAKVLLVIFIASPMVTFYTNQEPVFFGIVGLPGMRFSEGLALMMQKFLLVIPLLLGRAILIGEGGQKTLMIAFFAGGLAYSLPMLIEVRLSPQINNWIYGYYQHSFAQSIRFGGWRPLVFLNHGLWASFYAMMAFVAAFALYQAKATRSPKATLVLSGYLGGILVLTKSMGAIIYGITIIPIMLFLSKKWQIKVAVILAVFTLAYPVMKSADLVPVRMMLEQAASFDQERAGSLKFRFDNEDILQERAMAKPIFGWGSWGRNHILDPVSGNITTVTDGRWIITLGVYGWVGFFAEFLLLTYPIFALWRQSRKPGVKLPLLTAPLTLLLAINLADLIPNATLTPLTWLMAGALLGTIENMRNAALSPDRPPATDIYKTVL